MKQPNSKNYVGNPMGYFNDKAQFGRETASSNINGIEVVKQEGDASRSRRQDRLDSKLARKQTKAKIAAEKAKIRDSRHSNRKNGNKERVEFNREMRRKSENTTRLGIVAGEN